MTEESDPAMVIRYLIKTALWLGAMAALLFAAAGDIRWPQAWLFLAEYALTAGPLVAWLARHDPALLRERFAMPIHARQALWDRVFLIGVTVAFVLWFAMIGLDSRRYAWSHMPVGLEAIGALAVAGCMGVTWQVFRVNSFAVPQVRAQAEREQTVIDIGPYRYVRHPMYAGALLFFVGLPLMLGSWAGLLVAPIMAVAFAFRVVGEERMMRRELSGYDGYAACVRYRLVPGVW